MQRTSLLSLIVLIACGPAEGAQRTVEPPAEVRTGKARAADKPYGREGDPRRAKRVIRIDMSDTMQYFPDQIKIKRGDTVRFVVRNSGELPHEMVLGTMEELQKYAAATKRKPADHQGEPHATRVGPGGTGRIVWQFTRAGEFYFGCLVPGHFDAGMIGTIVVR